MYNRYIPNGSGYTRVAVEEAPRHHGEERRNTRPHQSKTEGQTGRTGTDFGKSGSPFLGFLGGEDKNAGIAGILKSLHLEDLDSGDILLLLIILFLFLEGDNIELVITLGLMLLLGLGDEKKEDQKE